MIYGEMLGPGVHVKPDGWSLRWFLNVVSKRVWWRDIPLTWRSMTED